jgi:hypothetical protein
MTLSPQTWATTRAILSALCVPSDILNHWKDDANLHYFFPQDLRKSPHDFRAKFAFHVAFTQWHNQPPRPIFTERDNDGNAYIHVLNPSNHDDHDHLIISITDNGARARTKTPTMEFELPISREDKDRLEIMLICMTDPKLIPWHDALKHLFRFKWPTEPEAQAAKTATRTYTRRK